MARPASAKGEQPAGAGMRQGVRLLLIAMRPHVCMAEWGPAQIPGDVMDTALPFFRPGPI
jgi:hypothetical protein